MQKILWFIVFSVFVLVGGIVLIPVGAAVFRALGKKALPRRTA